MIVRTEPELPNAAGGAPCLITSCPGQKVVTLFRAIRSPKNEAASPGKLTASEALSVPEGNPLTVDCLQKIAQDKMYVV